MSLSMCRLFKPIAPTPHLKAVKTKDKNIVEEVNPFLYTPFTPHRDKTVKDATKAGNCNLVKIRLCKEPLSLDLI